MYENGSVLGATTTGAGILALPNTSSSSPLHYVAILSIVIGSLIVLTTIVRFIAKKAYKA
jgi:hypothetical protein